MTKNYVMTKEEVEQIETAKIFIEQYKKYKDDYDLYRSPNPKYHNMTFDQWIEFRALPIVGCE
jgi:hypoxanthine phosphoribosyltransferase